MLRPTAASERIRNGIRMARKRYSPRNGQTWKASSTGTPMKAMASRNQSAMRSWRMGKIATSAAQLVLNWPRSRYSIRWPSDPLEDSFAEQALRSHKQTDQRQHVGEPVFDAATDGGTEISLGKLLASAGDQAADDRAWHRGKAPYDQHRQRLQGEKGDGVLHAELGAPDRRRNQRNKARDQPDHEPDPVQR